MNHLQVRLNGRLGKFEMDVDFTAPLHGVTALFGRSGSGKTSILRFIAGLQRFEQGKLRCGEETWQDARTFVPVHRRAIGYVFQEASLFPHLNVRRNLEYGWKRVAPSQSRVQFDDVVAWLGLGSLMRHRPHELSGGQRQRVAIGRALLTSPKLLLMDEPLASLDQESKAEILPYLERLFAELSLPVLYVSHAPQEVMRLAHQLILLEQGRVRASGPLNELLTRPDLPLAHLEEASAVLAATVERHDPHYHLTYLQIPGGRVALSQSSLAVGTQTRVCIHARDVSLALQPPQQTSISNILPARVLALSADPDPAQVLVHLELAQREAGSAQILARITRRSADHLQLTVGSQVFAQVKSVALMA